MVKDDGGQARYSALPHAVLTDSRTQHGHIVAYAVLQMHWWQGGECWASHATLATEAKCSERQLRRYLRDLVSWGFITERMRGQGQAKAYAPSSGDSASQQDTGVRLNQTPVSASEANRTPVSEQADTDGRFNRTPVSDPKKKTPEDTSGRKKTLSAPTEPAPKPTRSGQLIDLLKTADVPVTMRPQDHKALKDSGADPSLVAEAYGALFRGEWGDDFMRRSLSVQFVIGRLAAYESWKRNPRPSAPRRNGADPKPPARDVVAAWAGWKGRYGSNLDDAKGRGDDR